MKAITIHLKDEDFEVLSVLAAASRISVKTYLHRAVCMAVEGDMETEMSVLRDSEYGKPIFEEVRP